MKKGITGTICTAVLTAAVCFMTASCGKSDPPAYLLEGARDNGFVPAYRAYFELDGDSIKKISENRFDRYFRGDKNDYKGVLQDYYSFNIVADSGDPSGWEYEQGAYDSEVYDEELLIGFLEEIDTGYTGDVYVLITEFDDYTVLEIWEKDGNSITRQTTALFRDGNRISLPGNVSLESLRNIYRLNSTPKN